MVLNQKVVCAASYEICNIQMHWLKIANPRPRGSWEYFGTLENLMQADTGFCKGWRIKAEQTFRWHTCCWKPLSVHARLTWRPDVSLLSTGRRTSENGVGQATINQEWRFTPIQGLSRFLASKGWFGNHLCMCNSPGSSSAGWAPEPASHTHAHHASTVPSLWQQATAAGAPAAVQTSQSYWHRRDVDIPPRLSPCHRWWRRLLTWQTSQSQEQSHCFHRLIKGKLCVLSLWWGLADSLLVNRSKCQSQTLSIKKMVCELYCWDVHVNMSFLGKYLSI